MALVPRSIRRRTLTAVLACVTAALATASSTGCERTQPETPAWVESLPEQQTRSYHTQQSRAGVVEWELWGETAERFPDRSELELHGVRMIFYRDGEQDAVLTSERGTVDEHTHRTTARGNVVVVSANGRRLESEILHWDPQRRRIHTDAFVRFTDGDQIVTGYGMETDPDLADLVIERQVEGELPAESGGSEASGGGR